jgi:hypothetical protein
MKISQVCNWYSVCLVSLVVGFYAGVVSSQILIYFGFYLLGVFVFEPLWTNTLSTTESVWTDTLPTTDPIPTKDEPKTRKLGEFDTRCINTLDRNYRVVWLFARKIENMLPLIRHLLREWDCNTPYESPKRNSTTVIVETEKDLRDLDEIISINEGNLAIIFRDVFWNGVRTKSALGNVLVRLRKRPSPTLVIFAYTIRGQRTIPEWLTQDARYIFVEKQSGRTLTSWVYWNWIRKDGYEWENFDILMQNNESSFLVYEANVPAPSTSERFFDYELPSTLQSVQWKENKPVPKNRYLKFMLLL